VQEWTEEEEERLLATQEGRRLRELVIEKLRLATGDSHNANAPVIPIMDGETPVPVTVEQRREAGVHANGRATALEDVLETFLGGVP
jgi:hypothetical protein